MSLSVKNMLGGGGASPFAWGKYEPTVIPPIDAVNPTFNFSSSGNTITISNSSADLTLIGDNWKDYFDGFVPNSGTYPYFRKDSTILYVYLNSYTTLNIQTIAVTNATSCKLTFNDTYSQSSMAMKYEGTKHIKDGEDTIGNFLEYVTDKNPLKYPNGEVADDGFFYRYAFEGLYIWEKYKYKEAVTITNPTFTLEITDGKIFTIADANFDWLQLPSVYNSSAIKPSESTDAKTVIDFLDGFTNTSNGKFFSNTGSYSGSIMVYRDSSNWRFLSGVNYTNPPSFELATALTGWATNQKTFSYTGTKTIPAEIGDFIDYVISDNENAYPGDGEQDGYYYKKASGGITPEMFGCAKMAIDTFVPTSNIMVNTSNYTVNHSLGEIPKVVLIVANQLPSLNTGFSFIYTRSDFANKWYGIYLCGTDYSATSNLILQSNVTESTFRIWMQYTRYFVQGVEYSIITMA